MANPWQVRDSAVMADAGPGVKTEHAFPNQVQDCGLEKKSVIWGESGGKPNGTGRNNMAEHPWLKHYPAGIHWDTKIPPKPLYALLDESEAAFPNRPAMDFLGRHYTYTELASEVRKLTASLKAMGVRAHT